MTLTSRKCTWMCYDSPRNPLFSSVSPCLPLWLTCHSSHLDTPEPPPHSLTPPPTPRTTHPSSPFGHDCLLVAHSYQAPAPHSTAHALYVTVSPLPLSY